VVTKTPDDSDDLPAASEAASRHRALMAQFDAVCDLDEDAQSQAIEVLSDTDSEVVNFSWRAGCRRQAA
jgi:hypothetical protein